MINPKHSSLTCVIRKFIWLNWFINIHSLKQQWKSRFILENQFILHIYLSHAPLGYLIQLSESFHKHSLSYATVESLIHSIAHWFILNISHMHHWEIWFIWVNHFINIHSFMQQWKAWFSKLIHSKHSSLGNCIHLSESFHNPINRIQ